MYLLYENTKDGTVETKHMSQVYDMFSVVGIFCVRIVRVCLSNILWYAVFTFKRRTAKWHRLTEWLTNSLEQIPSWESNRTSVKKFCIFYRLWCITAFTRARHLFLVQINTVSGFPSHFFKINFDTILPSMPKSSKWSRSHMFPIKTLYGPFLFSTRATCPAHIILVPITQYLLSATDYKAPRYVVFSTPLSSRPS